MWGPVDLNNSLTIVIYNQLCSDVQNLDDIGPKVKIGLKMDTLKSTHLEEGLCNGESTSQQQVSCPTCQKISS